MTLAERDALDIVEKKMREVIIERNRAKWRNDWRPPILKLESIHSYLVSHQKDKINASRD